MIVQTKGSLQKKKTTIIVTLSLSQLTPTLRKEIGTVNIGTISWISDHPPSPLWQGHTNPKLYGRNMLKYTNFKQITVRNLGLEDPPPELYVPIISSFLVGILTDPPPTWQGQCHYNRSFFLKASLNVSISLPNITVKRL